MSGAGAKNSGDRGEWVAQAWALWVEGHRNLAALGRQFGKAPATVKANIEKYGRQRATEISEGKGGNPTAEYISGLEADLRDVGKFLRETTNDNAKVGAMKHRTAIRELLAAAYGVVTKRQATEISGPLEIVVQRVDADDGEG